MLTNEQRSRIRYLLNDEWVSDTGSPDDEDVSQRRFKAVLAKMGTEELHHFAMHFNWDCGIDELRHVLDHQKCDRGTALMIFWAGGPGYYYQYGSRDDVPEHERDAYDFLKEIEAKYMANGFARQTIRIDPRSIRIDPANMKRLDRTASYKAQGGAKRVPPLMFEPSPGDELEPLKL
jgi:hypothetical protein